MSKMMLTEGGNPSKNQELLETSEGIYLVSYGSFVAFKSFDGKTALLGHDWAYSRTTKRYVKRFLDKLFDDSLEVINLQDKFVYE